MNTNLHAPFLQSQRRVFGGLSGDTLTARTWDALMHCLTRCEPGMTVPRALELGIITAGEFSAAHAWAARTNYRRPA